MKTNLTLPLLMLCVADHALLVRAQSAGTFTVTGNMLTPRFGHTATLLPNGKVLIAGGFMACSFGFPGCLAAGGAEIYDPLAGTFAATGTMISSRPVGGILLPNGRVLFAEGYSTGMLAGVEVYDPSTGNFNAVGNTTTLTAVNAAILLNDGRVLLIGFAGRVSGAELYDPAASTSTAVGNWPPQIGSPFTVLVDGRVWFDSNAIYDPAKGAFSLAAGLSFNDTPPATLLMNGKVLLTGGNTDGGNVNLAELYDPATDKIGFTGRMATPRDGHTANLLPDGTVLIAGGAAGFNANTNRTPAISSAELYDPATGRFSATGNMTSLRFGHAAVVLNNGRVLITGGSRGDSSTSVTGMSSVELYTPNALVPAPVLFSLSGHSEGQAAIWHAETGEIAGAGSPAVAGEVLSMYTTSLADGGVIPPHVAVGGRVAEVLFFGPAPGYSRYYQVNFRVPSGVVSGPAVPLRLTYLGRPSNEVTIGVR